LECLNNEITTYGTNGTNDNNIAMRNTLKFENTLIPSILDKVVINQKIAKISSDIDNLYKQIDLKKKAKHTQNILTTKENKNKFQNLISEKDLWINKLNKLNKLNELDKSKDKQETKDNGKNINMVELIKKMKDDMYNKIKYYQNKFLDEHRVTEQTDNLFN
jgi:hypothetical protein